MAKGRRSRPKGSRPNKGSSGNAATRPGEELGGGWRIGDTVPGPPNPLPPPSGPVRMGKTKSKPKQGTPGTWDPGQPGRYEIQKGSLIELPKKVWIPGKPERQFQGPIDERKPKNDPPSGEVLGPPDEADGLGVYYFEKGRFLTRGKYGKIAGSQKRRG